MEYGISGRVNELVDGYGNSHPSFYTKYHPHVHSFPYYMHIHSLHDVGCNLIPLSILHTFGWMDGWILSYVNYLLISCTADFFFYLSRNYSERKNLWNFFSLFCFFFNWNWWTDFWSDDDDADDEGGREGNDKCQKLLVHLQAILV